MAKTSFGFLDRGLFRRSVKRWMRAAQHARNAPLSVLRQDRHRARQLRAHLNDVIQIADERLAQPSIGKTPLPTPHNADWAWRPELWRTALPDLGRCATHNQAKLDDQVSLFHDCRRAEISLRQVVNQSEADLAPFGLRLEVFAFRGSFLSIVIDLPEDGVKGLEKSHLIRLEMRAEVERPMEIYSRLNVQHGPNTEQVVRQITQDAERLCIEFDLAYSDLNEKQVEKAWIDLIFENPAMNEVILRDVTVARRPRAAM